MSKLYAAISLLLLVGCRQSENVSVLSVDVEAELREEVSIFDVFSKVELVALESLQPLSNHVFSGELFVTSDGDCLYYLDEKTFKIHVFDMNGNYRHVIDKVGRGHGEYTMGYQLSFNDEDSLIEVLNPMGKILRYTQDSLHFHSELDMMGKGIPAMHEMCRVGESYIVLSKNMNDRFWGFDEGEDELYSYQYCVDEDYMNYQSPSFSFFVKDGIPHSFNSMDGEIFSFDLSAGSTNPVYRWDFGKYQAKLSDIEKNLSVREYHSMILDYSKNHLSPFINIKYHAGHLYASIVFDGQIYPYSLIYDLETGESLLFGKTKEGMWFLPELFVDGIMYKFVDYEFLPDYVNREILDPSSQLEYDKVLMQRGAAVIKYYS